MSIRERPRVAGKWYHDISSDTIVADQVITVVSIHIRRIQFGATPRAENPIQPAITIPELDYMSIIHILIMCRIWLSFKN